MRHWSEAAARNQWPILEVLRIVLPPPRSWRILEIGSGTAQHAIFVTEHLMHISWQTSDLQNNLDAIHLTLDKHPHDRVARPLVLEAKTLVNHQDAYDAVFTANTCHIMSWEDARLMIQNVGTLLSPGGRFVIYGPFNVGGQADCESNYRFDQYLSQVNPRQGLRNREDVAVHADACGMSLIDCFAMPTNNQILVFEKRSAAFD